MPSPETILLLEVVGQTPVTIKIVKWSISSILTISSSLTVSLVTSLIFESISPLFSTYTTLVFSSSDGNVKSYSNVPSTISVLISYALSLTAPVASISSCVNVISSIVNLDGFSGNLVKNTLTLLFCGAIYVLPISTLPVVVATFSSTTNVGYVNSSRILAGVGFVKRGFGTIPSRRSSSSWAGTSRGVSSSIASSSSSPFAIHSGSEIPSSSISSE